MCKGTIQVQLYVSSIISPENRFSPPIFFGTILYVTMRLETLIKTLRKKNITVSVAESCTGGYLSYLLTSIPGSSHVFKGGIVVYSLEAKKKLANVPYRLTLKTHGISPETAADLAKNTRKIMEVDISLAIVGVAGPSPLGKIKPGTIYAAISDSKTTTVFRWILKGGRAKVRKNASKYLLEELYKKISSTLKRH